MRKVRAAAGVMGTLDFGIEDFQADVLNYIVDGRINTEDIANFPDYNSPLDFNTYKQAVYKMGEQILHKEKLNTRYKSNFENFYKNLYNRVMGGNY